MVHIVAAAAVPMNLITEPLVPSDCTMRGLDFMPLYLDRLMGSRTWARVMSCVDLNLGGYLINLWGATFKAVPAGSLEDDDDVLRQATGCPPHLWDRVRGHLLKGWQRCTDGRVYHPGACDIIGRIWETRTAKRAELGRARAAKAAKKQQRAKADANQGNLDLPGITPVAPEPANPPISAISSVTDVKPEVRSEEDRGAAPPLPPARRSTRGDLLPDRWCPSADSHLYVQRLGLDSDLMGEAFANRSRGFGHRSHDWQSRFRARCDQIAEQRAPRQQAQRDDGVSWMKRVA